MKSEAKKIAAIVPAYNEEERIEAVLKPLTRCGLIDEIIVVDDGSTDKTAHVARQYSVRVIQHSTNKGKGAALKTGIEATQADILLFIDADLVGLKEKHLDQLIQPLLEDPDTDMAVSRFVKGRTRTNISQRIAPILNSQRAVRRSFIKKLPDFSSSGFGVETIITRSAKRLSAKIREVPLEGVTHVTKEEKLGLIRGFGSRLRMYMEILRHLVSS